MRHVYTRGGDVDRRRRWSVGRRVSSGVTLCGAPEDGETLGRRAGEGSLQLEDWAAKLCPECRAALELSITKPQQGG